MSDKISEAFEQAMIHDFKCTVGSTDPYPAGLERDWWQVWQKAWKAASAQQPAPVAAPCPVQFNRLPYEALTAIEVRAGWSEAKERIDYARRVAEAAMRSCEQQLRALPAAEQPDTVKVGRDLLERPEVTTMSDVKKFYGQDARGVLCVRASDYNAMVQQHRGLLARALKQLNAEIPSFNERRALVADIERALEPKA